MKQNDDGSAGEPARRRTFRPGEQWRMLIEAQPASGVGVAAYCREHGVATSCFYRWRRLFTGSMGAKTSPPGLTASSGLPRKRRRRAPAIDGFAAVRVVPERGGGNAFHGESRSSSSESIRLLLAGGRELILPASMPTQQLVELLA